MFLLAKAVAPAANTSPALSSPLAAGAFCQLWRRRRIWRALLRALLALAGAMPATDTHAADLVPELRVASAYEGRIDADVYTAAWFTAAPRWSLANRLEFAVGVIRDAHESRPFGFFGPVWRFASRRSASFLEFSFGPTVIGGSTIDGRELGGNLHFRSAIAVGLAGGRRRNFEVALRIEHVSNGGLRSTNPGLDSIGLGFVILTGGRAGH